MSPSPRFPSSLSSLPPLFPPSVADLFLSDRNADLRMVFFRICGFLKQGILPVFVFDGPERPSWKRGHRVGGNVFGGRKPHVLREMFDLFGVPWKVAPGEAEAELAEMNRRGQIDVVLSVRSFPSPLFLPIGSLLLRQDDVDAFLFGAVKVVRNPSKSLSSNKSKTALARTASAPSLSQPSISQPSFSFQQSQTSLAHLPVDPSYAQALAVYTATDIFNSTSLTPDSLILVALLAGGDYSPTGFERVGVTIAIGLSEGGYASTLLEGVPRIESAASGSSTAMATFLADWRSKVAHELRTNEHKLFNSRKMKLADALEDDETFPSLEVINFYLHPRVSTDDPPDFGGAIDVQGLVPFCQDRFEWGNEEVESRMRNLLWLPLGMESLRRAAILSDMCRPPSSAPPSADTLPHTRWISRVSELKAASSTDYVPSYRVELSPSSFNPLIRSALPPSAADPFPLPDFSVLSSSQAETERASRKKQGRLAEPPKEATTSSFRHWVPVGFASVRGTELARAVEEYYDAGKRKKREKEEKEEAKRARAAARGGARSPTKSPGKVKATAKGKGKGRVPPPETTDEEDIDLDEAAAWAEESRRKRVEKEREAMRVAGGVKGKAKVKTSAGAVKEKPKGRRKSFLEQSEDEEEREDPFSTSTSKVKAKKTTTITLTSSPTASSDLEPLPPISSSRRPLKTSPLPSSKSASNPFSSFTSSKPTLTSAFGSSKPSAISGAAVAGKRKPTPPVDLPSDDNDDDDLFGTRQVPASSATLLNRSSPFPSSSAPSGPKPSSTKRRLPRPSSSASNLGALPPPSPTLSSASSDDGFSRRTVSHVSKARRGALEEGSPKKTRPAEKGKGKKGKTAKAGEVWVLSSTDEGEEEEVRGTEKGRSGRKVEKEESMTDFWSRREKAQEQKKQGIIDLCDSD